MASTEFSATDESKLITVRDKLTYDKESILGGGAFGTVYQGWFEKKMPAAVKCIERRRIVKGFDKSFDEAIYLLKANSHPGIIRYFCYEIDESNNL